MKKITFSIAILLIFIIAANGQNDTLYVMKGGGVINKQSIKQSDLDSIKFNVSDSMVFVKNNVIVNKQSIKSSDVDSVVFYKPTLGSSTTVTDYDGNVYNTVTIGTQVWMKENLKTTHYADGTAITLANSYSKWNALISTSIAYCWPEDNIINKDTYGAYYTWAAAMKGAASSSSSPSNIQGVCPTGWHLPSNAEYNTLIKYLGTPELIGGKLKESGTSHWITPNTSASNSSGFTALPASSRDSYGTLNYIGYSASFWTSTESDSNNAWSLSLNYNSIRENNSSYEKGNGFCVRCVKD